MTSQNNHHHQQLQPLQNEAKQCQSNRNPNVLNKISQSQFNNTFSTPIMQTISDLSKRQHSNNSNNTNTNNNQNDDNSTAQETIQRRNSPIFNSITPFSGSIQGNLGGIIDKKELLRQSQEFLLCRGTQKSYIQRQLSKQEKARNHHQIERYLALRTPDKFLKTQQQRRNSKLFQMYQRNGVPLTNKVSEVSYFNKNIQEYPSQKLIQNKLRDTMRIQKINNSSNILYKTFQPRQQQQQQSTKLCQRNNSAQPNVTVTKAEPSSTTCATTTATTTTTTQPINYPINKRTSQTTTKSNIIDLSFGCEGGKQQPKINNNEVSFSLKHQKNNLIDAGSFIQSNTIQQSNNVIQQQKKNESNQSKWGKFKKSSLLLMIKSINSHKSKQHGQNPQSFSRILVQTGSKDKSKGLEQGNNNGNNNNNSQNDNTFEIKIPSCKVLSHISETP